MTSDLEYGENRLVFDRVEGAGPAVIFLGGYASARRSTKASHLHFHALEQGWEYLRFDYSGHGDSTGRFEDATLGLWLNETLAVIDHNYPPERPLILVGSSMGGWLALLAAQKLGTRVAGVVAVACGADFTEEVIRPMLSAPILKKLELEKVLYRPNQEGPPTPITWDFLDEARNHLLLNGPIAIESPVRLIHGYDDQEVPWTISARVLKNLTSPDATLLLVKNGDHRLSGPIDLARLTEAIEELLQKTQGSAPAG